MRDYNSEKNRTEHRRVDRMENVRVLTDRPRDGLEIVKDIDMHDYTRYTFGMFSDSPDTVKVSFLCTNRMRNVFYDRFGDVMMIPEDDDHFKATVPIAVSPQFFGWVLGLGKNVQIIGPEEVRTQMRDYLADISGYYQAPPTT